MKKYKKLVINAHCSVSYLRILKYVSNMYSYDVNGRRKEIDFYFNTELYDSIFGPEIIFLPYKNSIIFAHRNNLRYCYSIIVFLKNTFRK